jgi:hypothetical protein
MVKPIVRMEAQLDMQENAIFIFECGEAANAFHLHSVILQCPDYFAPLDSTPAEEVGK